MLYTEKEKHEIERVKEVFAEHLRQRPAERKNVIYQTRCQEPCGASGTFFVDFL